MKTFKWQFHLLLGGQDSNMRIKNFFTFLSWLFRFTLFSWSLVIFQWSFVKFAAMIFAILLSRAWFSLQLLQLSCQIFVDIYWINKKEILTILRTMKQNTKVSKGIKRSETRRRIAAFSPTLLLCSSFLLKCLWKRSVERKSRTLKLIFTWRLRVVLLAM